MTARADLPPVAQADLDAEPSTGTVDPVPEVAAPDVPLPWYETVWQSTRTADVPGARR